MQLATKLGTVCALALLLAVNRGRAQTAPETAPQTTEDALHAMVQQAAVIFAGKVTAVRRLDGVNGATGVVEIEFAVDDAVRGVNGDTYTLREWAALWSAGNQPLRIGQRYLMLLHAPSAAGLSSPVGGQDGAIPIRQGVLTAELLRALPRLAGVAAAVDTRTVDLRWVSTRVVRPVSYAANFAPHPTALPIGVRANAIGSGTMREPEPTSTWPVSEAPVAASRVDSPLTQDAGYATVLALLRNWEKADYGAR